MKNIHNRTHIQHIWMPLNWQICQNIPSSYVKEQSYVHAVGTLKEMDGSLKDIKTSALSLVIYNICRFKPFQLLVRCSIWSSDIKIIQNCIIIIFHLMCLSNPSSELAVCNVASDLLFHNWCKTIKWPFLFTIPKNTTKMCVWERFHLCWK